MAKRRDDPMAAYDTIADTVGGVPNLRPKDNLYQLIAIVVGALLGAGGGAILVAVMGWDLPVWVGAILGGIVGVIGGTFVSGIVLLVLGWVRAAQGK